MMAGYEELSKIRTPPYRMRTISIIRLSLTESDIWLLTSCICEIDTKFCTNYKKGTRLCIRKSYGRRVVLACYLSQKELSKLTVLIVLLYTHGHAFTLIGLTLYLLKEVVKHRPCLPSSKIISLFVVKINLIYFFS